MEKRGLLLCLIFLLGIPVFCRAAGFPVKDDNTLFLVDFEEGQGSVVHDVVSGKELKIVNAPSEEPGSSQWVEGIKGKALLLQGTSQISGNVPYSLVPPFTIEVWCRPTARPLGAGGYFFAKSIYKTGGCIIGITPGGQITVDFPDPTTYNSMRSESAIAIGKWHHIAFAYDGKIGRIYLDGKLDKEQPLTGYIEIAGETGIGYTGGYFYYQQGLIEGVKVSKVAKTDFSADGALVAEANKSLNLSLPKASLPDAAAIDRKKFDKDLILHLPLDGDVTAILGPEETLEPANANQFVFDSGVFDDNGALGAGYGSQKSLQYKYQGTKLAIPGQTGATLSCWIKVNDLFTPERKKSYRKADYLQRNNIFGIKTKDVPAWYTDYIDLTVAEIDNNHITLLGRLAGVQVTGDVYNLEVGKWHNLVISAGKSEQNRIKGSLYLDGVRIGVYFDQSPFSAPRQVQEFWVGVVGGNDGVLFSNDDGKVDEICLWSRPFSAEEVKEYYAGILGAAKKAKKE